MAVFFHPAGRQERRDVVTCKGLDYLGRGLAADKSGHPCTAPGLMPGECAEVLIRERQVTELIKLRTKSPERQPPDCACAGRCGGCPLAHLPPQMAVAAKAAGLRRYFAAQSGLELPPPEIISFRPTLYRRTCRLATGTDHGHLRLGFRQGRDAALAVFEHCPVLTARLSDLTAALRRELDGVLSRSTLGHVRLLDGGSAGAGAALHLSAPLTSETGRRLAAVGERLGITLTAEDPALPGQTALVRVLSGDPAGIKLKLGRAFMRCQPASFVQVHAEVAAALLQAVLQTMSALEPGAAVLDLCSGGGAFALELAAAGFDVSGVEVVPEMVAAAERSAAEQKLNARFYCHDLTKDAGEAEFARRSYAAAVIDPGRSGCPQAVSLACRLKIPLIVLVSCAPAAGCRDLRVLAAHGYRVQSFSVLDMFPRTAYAEALCVLSRTAP